MEVSTTPTEDLKQHLTECAVELEYRRNTGERGAPNGNDDFKVMSDDTLREHQLYVMREVVRRDGIARHHAFFAKNIKN